MTSLTRCRRSDDMPTSSGLPLGSVAAVIDSASSTTPMARRRVITFFIRSLLLKPRVSRQVRDDDDRLFGRCIARCVRALHGDLVVAILVLLRGRFERYGQRNGADAPIGDTVVIDVLHVA